MRTRLQFFLSALMALAFVVGASGRADAAFIAWICDDALCVGGGDTIVTDGAAGDAAPGVAGSIVAVGVNVGGFTVTVNNSSSKPLLPQAQMDLNFSATSGAGATPGTPAHVWLYASDTDFTVGGPLSGVLDGNSAGTGSINASIYGGLDNTSGTLAAGVSTGAIAFPPVSFHASLLKGAAVANPYALTIGVEIIQTAGSAITTGDFLVRSIPEPASLTLLGTGILGALARRRKKAAKA